MIGVKHLIFPSSLSVQAGGEIDFIIMSLNIIYYFSQYVKELFLFLERAIFRERTVFSQNESFLLCHDKATYKLTIRKNRLSVILETDIALYFIPYKC